jgi:hypothetical protein
MAWRDRVKMIDLSSMNGLLELEHKAIITVYWETGSTAENLLCIGTERGELFVYIVTPEDSRTKLLGISDLKSPILSITSSPLALLVATAEYVYYIHSVVFEATLSFNVHFGEFGNLVVLPKALVCASGTIIKFWKSVVKSRKKTSRRSQARKVRYSHDKALDVEVRDVVRESQKDYEDRLERNRNVENFNGARHGMSPIELDEFAIQLSLQSLSPDERLSQGRQVDGLNDDLTEEEWIQIALSLSQ